MPAFALSSARLNLYRDIIFPMSRPTPMSKSSAATSAKSVPAAILANARRFGERDAIVFLERGETISSTLSYDALVAKVARIAGRLMAEGLSGQPVMIVLPAGGDFIVVFLACLWARIAAIPAPYSTASRPLDRFQSILSDARPAAIVTDEPMAARLAALASDNQFPRLLTASSLTEGAADSIEPISGPTDELALIQYTSGSTRAPRGIAITHANLRANQAMIASAFLHDENCVTAHWLPHFHDMGLLGAILQPLFVGGTTVLMDPLAFIQKPIRWLRAIDRFRASTAGGPCFAFDLCARRCAPGDLEKLDLSCWRVAYCGAEPIRRQALDRFCDKLSVTGFDGGAIVPCYGLAEATLIVSSTKPGQGLREFPVTRRDLQSSVAAQTAVSCGGAVQECVIRILGEDGAQLPEGEIGEICVGGEHLSPGVWRGEERRIAPFSDIFIDSAGERLLPTGDIGAIVDGELVPIDRIKDTIIIYGRKLHASDVEAAVLAHPLAGKLLAACAISVDGPNGEEMVVLCEMERQSFRAGEGALLAAQLPKLVAEAFGVLPRLNVLPYGSLPRTTSGKIQRFNSKSAYLAGELDAATPPDARQPGKTTEQS